MARVKILDPLNWPENFTISAAYRDGLPIDDDTVGEAKSIIYTMHCKKCDATFEKPRALVYTTVCRHKAKPLQALMPPGQRIRGAALINPTSWIVKPLTQPNLGSANPAEWLIYVPGKGTPIGEPALHTFTKVPGTLSRVYLQAVERVEDVNSLQLITRPVGQGFVMVVRSRADDSLLNKGPLEKKINSLTNPGMHDMRGQVIEQTPLPPEVQAIAFETPSERESRRQMEAMEEAQQLAVEAANLGMTPDQYAIFLQEKGKRPKPPKAQHAQHAQHAQPLPQDDYTKALLEHHAQDPDQEQDDPTLDIPPTSPTSATKPIDEGMY